MNAAALQGDLLKEPRIRVTALGIFRRGDQIFLAEGYDPIKGETFYRPLGGGVEFGERAVDTLIREMKEETGLSITNLRYRGMCENIFTYLGQPGHEVVFVYEADFVDESIYRIEELRCQEDNGVPFKALWKGLDTFGTDKNGPLYPDGLMELLKAN